MIAKIHTAANIGLQVEKVFIEVGISGGLPDLRIVGLPDAAVRESRERVRLAIKNSGFYYPMRRIVVNLAPANIKKEGPFFDLPIAVGILQATGQISQQDLSRFLFLGELSLDGALRKVNGVLPIVLHFHKEKEYEYIVPSANIPEITITGKSCLVFDNLQQIVSYLDGNSYGDKHEGIKIDIKASDKKEPSFDFKMIKGQKIAKRALEIAVAGGHNILLQGPPGTGKTMLARSVPGILPDLDRESCLEISKIYSIAGELHEQRPIIKRHPFRSPHHSSTRASLIGGGSIPKPGEVSLSHLGVLFLDEITEFPRHVLESLREPLEEGEVTLSRALLTCRYPADFMLVASMNPCPCGYFGSNRKACVCDEFVMKRYMSKLSGPLLDRIDLVITTEEIEYDDLHSKMQEESSNEVKRRVSKARDIQKERFNNKSFSVNAGMKDCDITEFCKIDQASKELLKEAYTTLNLSARAHNRILKISRTIADLAAQEKISMVHLTEAIYYRT